MIPKDKVQSLIERHKAIEIELSSGSINSKDFKSKSKEYAELNEIVPYAKKFLNYEFEKKDLENSPFTRDKLFRAKIQLAK